MGHSTLTIPELQKMADRCPFNAWLGIAIQEAVGGRLVLTARWRDEMMGAPERKLIHGGVLASLVDAAGDYAVATLLGHASPTVDLRTDYHRVAAYGTLTVTARVVKLGRTLSVAEAEVHDIEGRLAASGRAVYLTAQTTGKE
ncbi:PaaI family thioesterase [Tropicimonas isoalkanivorans]|uniref:Uncharacterized domain 1-containing protein n=1 Tax=Tropicimonas isoalkanivorans TaxID=441112 RepID=A0A1I1HYV3_9RHOB|nr:PaaI family thioesterase [Tropicimonas isoalkanivorans]SFC27138.1 uncharacterized domain 1-containing protein [Tropicimonas isoalkanivorans]